MNYIKQADINEHESGSMTLEKRDLMTMTHADQSDLEAHINRLAMDNPNVIFTTEVSDLGTKISWVHSNE